MWGSDGGWGNVPWPTVGRGTFRTVGQGGDELIRLMMGDCLERMGEIEAGSVDLIACDLPYGTTSVRWDSVIPLEPMWEAFGRILRVKGGIVLTSSQPFTSALIMSNPGWFRHEWIWDKRQCGNPMLARCQPLKVHESVVVFGRDPPDYRPIMIKGKARFKGTDSQYSEEWNFGAKDRCRKWSDEYYPKSIISFDAGRQEKVHPTQKPVALFEYLIRTYSNEGETVLDCTMGSGTTGVACVNTNRSFIGIERDPGYFRIASDRIAAAQSATPLLSPA